jgi:hypothetical protein
MSIQAKFCYTFALIILMNCKATHGQNFNKPTPEIQYPLIKIGSQEIPKAYWENGNGDYNKVLDYLIAGYPGKVEVTFLPSSRLNRFFNEGIVDCLYVSVKKNRTDVEFLGPTNKVTITAYVRNDHADIQTPQDLSDIPFAIDFNLKTFAENHSLSPSLSLQSQIQMIDLLAKGRIDALVGYDYDLDLLVKEMDYANQLKRASIKFAEFEDGMTCHKTEKSKTFREMVRTNIIKAQKTGFLKKIFDH